MCFTQNIFQMYPDQYKLTMDHQTYKTHQRLSIHSNSPGVIGLQADPKYETKNWNEVHSRVHHSLGAMSIGTNLRDKAWK